MDKRTKYKLERGKEMTSPVIRAFEGSMIGLILLSVATAVTPRVSQAQEEKRISLLAERLHQVRASIAVYQAEHEGALPGLTADGQVSAEAFTAALTSRDQLGRGPYLKEIPLNPFADSDTAGEVTVVSDLGARPDGKECTGWWFNAATGHFTACDSTFHAAF
jgi:type II secretory pathway pseudopilin PulG